MEFDLHTRLCEQIGIEFPVVAFNHCKDTVAAVSNAGGLGMLGASGRTPAELVAEVRWIKEQAPGRPFGVDILMPASAAAGTADDLRMAIPPEHVAFVERTMHDAGIPAPKHDEAAPEIHGWGYKSTGISMTPEQAADQIAALLDEGVAVIATALGPPPSDVIDDAHRQGATVMTLVGTSRQAERACDAGVDMVVAQGYDAGGHTGKIGTFSLVTEVVETIAPTPVIAAGGIAHGRQLIAAIALGAVGVWTGTMWLVCSEADVDPVVQEKLLRASAADSVISRGVTGKTLRQLRSGITRMWEQPDAPDPLAWPLQGLLMGDVLRSAFHHHVEDFMSTPAGQGVGLLHQRTSARQMLLDFMVQAGDGLDSLTVSTSRDGASS